MQHFARTIPTCLLALLAGIPSAAGQYTPAEDQAWTDKFTAFYPARPAPIADLPAYFAQYPFDRYIGDSITGLINRMNAGEHPTALALPDLMEALNEMYHATLDLKYPRENRRLIEAILAYRDDKRGVQIYDGRIVKAWGSDIPGVRRDVFAGETAAIIFPMFEFLRIAAASPVLNPEIGDRLNTMATEVVESLQFHVPDYVAGPESGVGHFIYRNYYDPALEGKPLPAHQQATFGRALWSPWKITGITNHRDTAIRLGLYMKNRLYYCSDGSYSLSYQLPESPVTPFPYTIKPVNSEDIWHGFRTIAFPIMLGRDGELFTAEDMRRFSRTANLAVLRMANGVPVPEVNGSPLRDFHPSFASPVAGFARLQFSSPEAFERAARRYLLYIGGDSPLEIALLFRTYLMQTTDLPGFERYEEITTHCWRA